MKKGNDRKQEIEKLRKQNSLKHMYYNRYLMVRYFLAVFVFANFYWALYSMQKWIMVIPLIMLLAAVLPCFENMKAYGETAIQMRWTKRYYQLQLGVSAGVLILVCTPLFPHILPFLKVSGVSQIAALVISMLGCAMAYCCICRLKKIEGNEDKQHARIRQLKKAMHL